MNAIVVRGAMGLRPGQVLHKLGTRTVRDAEFIAIEKTDGYKVLKARYGFTGHLDQLPDYAERHTIVTLP